MTLTLDDLPEGAALSMEETPPPKTGVRDSHVKLFEMCSCGLGTSKPVFGMSVVSVSKSEAMAKLGMSLTSAKALGEEVASGFNEGARGKAGAVTVTSARRHEGIGDDGFIVEVSFGRPEQPGVFQVGLVRVDEVIVGAGIMGLEGQIHTADLEDLMRVAVARVNVPAADVDDGPTDPGPDGSLSA